VSLQGIAASQQRSVEQVAVERLRTLVLESAGQRMGSAAALLGAIRELPRLSGSDVEELEAVIRKGRLPVNSSGVFSA
jgi:hypothetical protein